MRDLERALRRVADNGDRARFVGGRDRRVIEVAERTLGVHFPPTYRRFLAELGAGSIAGAEFYGVIDEDWTASPPDAVGSTLEERDQSELPDRYVLVGETGDGDWYLLDTADHDGDGESPVIRWIPGASPDDAPPERVADSFGAFFDDRTADALG